MPPPRTTYVICATPRSGSHLLAEAFQITGIAGNPDEYFITDKTGQLENKQGNIAELYGEQSLESFHKLVLSLGSTPNGVFGIIIQWDYLHHIFANFRQLPQYQHLSDRALLDALFYNPKYFWLKRQDKVRQAISWVKAHQTGEWALEKNQPPVQSHLGASLAYDFNLIDQNVKRFVNTDKAWESFFQINQIEPFVVVYEALAQSFEETSLILLDNLGIPHPQEINFLNRKWQKQANTINDTWVRKYRWQKKSLLHRSLRFLSSIRFRFLSSLKYFLQTF